MTLLALMDDLLTTKDRGQMSLLILVKLSVTQPYWLRYVSTQLQDTPPSTTMSPYCPWLTWVQGELQNHSCPTLAMDCREQLHWVLDSTGNSGSSECVSSSCYSPTIILTGWEQALEGGTSLASQVLMQMWGSPTAGPGLLQLHVLWSCMFYVLWWVFVGKNTIC